MQTEEGPQAEATVPLEAGKGDMVLLAPLEEPALPSGFSPMRLVWPSDPGTVSKSVVIC